MIKVKKTEIDKKEVTERRHENTLALTEGGEGEEGKREREHEHSSKNNSELEDNTIIKTE